MTDHPCYEFYEHPEHGMLRKRSDVWSFDVWSAPRGVREGRWRRLRGGLTWAFMWEITEERAKELIGSSLLYSSNHEGDGVDMRSAKDLGSANPTGERPYGNLTPMAEDDPDRLKEGETQVTFIAPPTAPSQAPDPTDAECRAITFEEWLAEEDDPLAVIYGVKPADPAVTIVPSERTPPRPAPPFPVRWLKHFDYGLLREAPRNSLRFDAWCPPHEQGEGLWHSIFFDPFSASMSEIDLAYAEDLIGNGDLYAPADEAEYRRRTDAAMKKHRRSKE